MRVFDQQLLRLKQVLGLTEDQAVAATLGMSKAAFADRKRRDAFPVDKLKALATDRPELRLDVSYVLSGVNDELQRRLDAVSMATRIADSVQDERSRYDVQAQVFEALVDQLSTDEQRLVHCFRRANAKGRALMMATAVTVAGEDLGASATRPAKTKRGSRR